MEEDYAPLDNITEVTDETDLEMHTHESVFSSASDSKLSELGNSAALQIHSPDTTWEMPGHDEAMPPGSDGTDEESDLSMLFGPDQGDGGSTTDSLDDSPLVRLHYTASPTTGPYVDVESIEEQIRYALSILDDTEGASPSPLPYTSSSGTDGLLSDGGTMLSLLLEKDRKRRDAEASQEPATSEMTTAQDLEADFDLAQRNVKSGKVKMLVNDSATSEGSVTQNMTVTWRMNVEEKATEAKAQSDVLVANNMVVLTDTDLSMYRQALALGNITEPDKTVEENLSTGGNEDNDGVASDNEACTGEGMEQRNVVQGIEADQCYAAQSVCVDTESGSQQGTDIDVAVDQSICMIDNGTDELAGLHTTSDAQGQASPVEINNNNSSNGEVQDASSNAYLLVKTDNNSHIPQTTSPQDPQTRIKSTSLPLVDDGLEVEYSPPNVSPQETLESGAASRDFVEADPGLLPTFGDSSSVGFQSDSEESVPAEDLWDDARSLHRLLQDAETKPMYEDIQFADPNFTGDGYEAITIEYKSQFDEGELYVPPYTPDGLGQRPKRSMSLLGGTAKDTYDNVPLNNKPQPANVECEYPSSPQESACHDVDQSPKKSKKKVFNKLPKWRKESKVLTFENVNHEPVCSKVRIFHKSVTWKAEACIGSLTNLSHVPGGGDVRIPQQKLKWKAESKLRSLSNPKVNKETDVNVDMKGDRMISIVEDDGVMNDEHPTKGDLKAPKYSLNSLRRKKPVSGFVGIFSEKRNWKSRPQIGLLDNTQQHPSGAGVITEEDDGPQFNVVASKVGSLGKVPAMPTVGALKVPYQQKPAWSTKPKVESKQGTFQLDEDRKEQLQHVDNHLTVQPRQNQLKDDGDGDDYDDDQMAARPTQPTTPMFNPVDQWFKDFKTKRKSRQEMVKTLDDDLEAIIVARESMLGLNEHVEPRFIVNRKHRRVHPERTDVLADTTGAAGKAVETVNKTTSKTGDFHIAGHVSLPAVSTSASVISASVPRTIIAEATLGTARVLQSELLQVSGTQSSFTVRSQSETPSDRFTSHSLDYNMGTSRNQPRHPKKAPVTNLEKPPGRPSMQTTEVPKIQPKGTHNRLLLRSTMISKRTKDHVTVKSERVLKKAQSKVDSLKKGSRNPTEGFATAYNEQISLADSNVELRISIV